jgi:hypothetical protein
MPFGVIRRAVVRGDRRAADCLAHDLEPLLPLVGVLRRVVCIEQQPAAARAASLLFAEQPQQERA